MMSRLNPVHPRQTDTVLALVPQPATFSGGNVIELPDTGATPAPSKPDDADILKAISELSKKLSVLAKNQRLISDRLHHIEGLMNKNSSNVVNGFVYMRWLIWAVAYWTLHSDDDTWGRNVPKMPHWH